MNEIGRRIKELRTEIDITQSKLAEIVGVTQDSISLWENGKRIPDTQYIIGLAEFFDVTTDYILGISNDFDGLRFGHEGREKEWLSADEMQLLVSYRKQAREIKKEILELAKKD